MTAGALKLVIGASGFVGSHVTRQLVERGDSVRVLIRSTSSTRGFDDLDVERHYGDIFDDAALRKAMAGCQDVFYCVVDARAWLRDPAPLFRTNVEGLRHVLDAALASDLRRFVFTSTIGTIALSDSAPATEDLPFNWFDQGGAYVQSRVEAENLVLSYATERGLPAVAMCISNTYGPRDWQPTPHGGLLAAVACGKFPIYLDDVATEVVGIEDAARALLLAADSGRNGERYIISERYISQRELFEIAADAAGVRRPWLGIPLKAVQGFCRAADFVTHAVLRKPPNLMVMVNLMNIMSPMSHAKATRELGWRPEPVHDAVGKAVAFNREYAQTRPWYLRP